MSRTSAAIATLRHSKHVLLARLGHDPYAIGRGLTPWFVYRAYRELL